MKQAEDKFTQDMFPAPQGAAATLYRVYVVTEDGIVLVWSNLSRAKALAMHKANEKNFSNIQSSTGLTRFGWEEQK